MKKLKSLIVILLSICILFSLTTFSEASELSVSVNSPKLGDNLTATINIPADTFGYSFNVTVKFDKANSVNSKTYASFKGNDDFTNTINHTIKAAYSGTGTVTISEIKLVDANAKVLNSTETITKNFTVSGGDTNTNTTPTNTTPTNTTPTNTTPTPTPTPDATYSNVNEAVVTTETVNLRSDANTNASIIEKIAKGTKGTRTGVGNNGWSKVTFNGKSGFMSSQYIKADTGNPTDQITFQDVNEKVKTLETVNLRQNYTTDSAKVDTIAKGTEGVRTGIGSNGWSKVTFNGKQGYMSSKYLEKTGDNTNTNATFKDTNDTVYTTEICNFRKGYTTSSEKISTLQRGTELKRKAVGTNGWSLVTYDGKDGYVYSEYLTTEKVEVKFTDKNDTMYIRTGCNFRKSYSTSSDKIGFLEVGTEVKRTAVGDNGWSKIKSGNNEGYVMTRFLTSEKPKDPEFEEVTKVMTAKQNCNVRESWTTSSAKLGLLEKGADVTVTGIGDNGWIRVDYDGKVAYISSPYLEDKKDEVPENVVENNTPTELETLNSEIGVIPEVGHNIADTLSIIAALTGLAIVVIKKVKKEN